MLSRFFPPGSKSPPTEAPFVAISVCCVGENHFHAGIIHGDVGSPLSILHLFWHEAIENETFPGSPKWEKMAWAVPELDPAVLPTITGFCRRIAKVKPKIPYALYCDESVSFSNDAKELIFGKRGFGLTCSTFILAVFQSQLIPLVDYKSWPKLTPKEVQEWKTIIERLFEDLRHHYPFTDVHLSKVRKEAVECRYKPCDVVGACTAPPYPATFKLARPASDEISKQLPLPLPRLKKSGTVGKVFDYKIRAELIGESYQIGMLPEGLSFSENRVAGTPVKSGLFEVKITATSSGGKRREFILFLDITKP